MAKKQQHTIEEHAMYGLGRVVQHDPRSKAHRLPMLQTPIRGAHPTKDIKHETEGPVLNQGNVGMCVGAATAHILNTHPLRAHIETKHPKLFIEKDALDLYSQSTKLDSFPWSYPPADTGTSGLAMMKVLKKLGLAKGYKWAFGVEEVLGVIAYTPLLIGIPWYKGMFDPDKKGQVHLTGKIVGGHEICLYGFELVSKTNMSANLFWFRNSWGKSWGKNGNFSMTVADLDRLLANSGDAVIPILA